MRVVVTGIGLVNALGLSTLQTWHQLLVGNSGLQRLTLFPELPEVWLGLVGHSPQSIEALIQASLWEAIADANLASPPANLGVVIGSSRGNQAELEKLARTETDFSTWLTTFQFSPSAIAAQLLQSQGPILAPRAACATGLWAIAQGADLIRQGLTEVVIAGGVEAPITPLTIAGFQKMGALTSQGAAPFDLHRSGFVLAEGGALFVLESEEHARQRGQTPYGVVLGFGSSADGYHVSAPNPEATSAHKAIHHCLTRSQMGAESIDFIHTHGTGTKLNDENEARIIQTLCPQYPPCLSSKGALGHTLGASGAIGSAICLLGIKHGMLPPTVGLMIPDPACNINLSQQSRRCDFQTALCLSFGFGGQNAAIAFAKI